MQYRTLQRCNLQDFKIAKLQVSRQNDGKLQPAR